MPSHLKEKSTRETSTTRAVRPVILGSQGLGGGAVCSLGRHQAWASTSTTSVPRAHAGAPVTGRPHGLSPVVLHSLRRAGRHKATEAGAPRRDFLYSRHTRRSLRKTSITEGSSAEGRRARPPAPRCSPPSPGLRGRAQPRAFSRSLDTCPEATRPASTCPHLPSGSSPTSNAGPLLWGPSLPAEAGPNRSVPGGQACGHRLRTVPRLPHPWARSFVWRLRTGSFGSTGRPFSTVTVTAPPPSRCQPLLADGTATHGRSGGRTGDHTA